MQRPKLMTLFNCIESNRLKVSFGLFLNFSSTIKPRAYTMCGAGPDPELIIKLEEHGLCSGALARAEPGTPMQILIKPSSFRDPLRWQHVVMVATGTGLAPFRAFIQLKERTKASCRMSLFFGCRHSDEDFIFKREIEGWLDSKVLDDFFPAFSRQ